MNRTSDSKNLAWGNTRPKNPKNFNKLKVFYYFRESLGDRRSSTFPSNPSLNHTKDMFMIKESILMYITHIPLTEITLDCSF